MGFLPTPLEMGALGGMLLVGAALVFWFLHLIKLALYMGVAAVLLFMCASVAYGYEKMGEDKIRPQLEAAEARLAQLDAEATQFRSDAMVARDRATALVKSKNAAIVALNKQLEGRLNALPPEVANLSIPAVASVQLNTNLADANDWAIAPGAGDEARAAAAAAAATTVRDWVAWGNAVSIQYGRVASQLIALQSYVDGLAAASARAAPVP